MSFTSSKSDAQQKNLTQQKKITMTTTDFTTTIVVDQTPEEVFNAINNPRGWWSEEIEGGTAKLNDEFDYHYKDVHISKMKLIEVIPNKKVVWLVMVTTFSLRKTRANGRVIKLFLK